MANFTSQDVAAMQGVGASIANLANTLSVSGTTKKDREFMLEMWERQKNEWYYQQQYAEEYQRRLTQDARQYAEDLTAREWDLYNSPTAQIEAMRKAGMNPNALLSKGSSPVSPVQTDALGAQNPSITGSGGASLPGYSPRYYQDPLVMAQVADLTASADLKRSQAELTGHEAAYKDSLTALNGSKQLLTNLQAEGVPFANRMAELNLSIASALKDTTISLGKGELDKMIMQTALFARQIQDYDDRHDLHGLRKQELKNQLDIQVASEALLLAREAAVRKGIDLTDAQIAMVWEQALNLASETDLNTLAWHIRQPELDYSRIISGEDYGFRKETGYFGQVGSFIGYLLRGLNPFNDKPIHGTYYRPDRVPQRSATVRAKYKGK